MKDIVYNFFWLSRREHEGVIANPSKFLIL